MTVKVEQLTGGYGKRPVIKDINFELNKGNLLDLLALMALVRVQRLNIC